MKKKQSNRCLEALLHNFKMASGGNVLYYWALNRIRSIAATFGLFGSMCVLFVSMLAIAVLLVISLIPLYLNRDTSEALGERYCINNYSLIVGFQIPQYNTTFTLTKPTATYQLSGSTQNVKLTNTVPCGASFNLSTSETISTIDNCNIQLLSVIYPAVPEARVFDSYALSEACYRTLQSCNYDSLLTACILSNCVAVASLDATTNGSYPLTVYRLRCTANIYYRTRCVDAPASFGLFYSSAQKNSACRRQRLNRINTCLNSSVQLSNVPCMIGVSSGRVTYKSAVCTEAVASSVLTISTFRTLPNIPDTISPGINVNPSTNVLISTISSELFSASDDTDGHSYRISSINSETYPSTQLGALYCGGITLTQIAASITTAINSQSSR